MAKSTRVHILAKELGVNSKAIVAKCQAEGLDIKNHMSTISLGLAATIREWFSEGDHTTTVEKTQRVDLEKVRIKKTAKKKVAKKKTKATEVLEVVESTEVAEITKVAEVLEVAETVEVEAVAVAEVKPVKKAAKKVAKRVARKKTSRKSMSDKMAAVAVAGGESLPEVEPKELADDGAKQEEAGEVQEVTEVDETAEPKAPTPEIYQPPALEVVKPAGPMLEKPKPAKLAGPRVIRVEKIEPHEIKPRRAPRPAGGRGGGGQQRPRYDAPIAEPLMPGSPAAGGAAGAKGGKKGKGRTKSFGEDKKPWESRKMHAKDVEDRQARIAAVRGGSTRARPSRRIESRRVFNAKPIEVPETANIAEPIVVKELSAVLCTRTSVIIGKLMGQGVMATANQTVATEVAELIALELGCELIVQKKKTFVELIDEEFQSRERAHLERRPPVITMLGHVDHGKTSLLDRIRSTSVADGEAGGITQHIGSYQVEWNGRKITFLDTPGHEAFTAMRARGANMTDIVVLVVAADDGLMPQTIEAIHHAKAAGVELIVALNKIDLPGVDINRIYGQLAEHELTPAEWSGNTEIVKTSATTGQGIEELIEHLDYTADVKEYKADSTIPATGWVIESKMTPTQGPVATLLLKEGILKKGDTVLVGGASGRVRTMTNSHGKRLKQATSSMAVEISGLDEVPTAGDKFYCMKDLARAKAAAEQSKALAREKTLASRSNVTLENLFSQIEAGKVKELNLIVKADVQGSVDVLNKYLTDLNTDEVKIKILHSAVGGINEGDIVLAEASGAIVIGFNVRSDDQVKSIADAKGVDIRLYSIIYRITEDLKAAMVGMLEPRYEEKELGKLTVRGTFKHSRIGTIAGCLVNSGVVMKNSKLRLIRENIVIREKCSIDSLKHFKEDVREVKSGNECGLKIAGFDDVKEGDVFEVYDVIEIAREL